MRSLKVRFSHRGFWLVLFLVLMAVMLVSNIVLADAVLQTIDRWVVGAGGGTSTFGKVRLDGTFGQTITGFSNGGEVALSAGFWAGSNGTYFIFLPIIVR